MLFWRHNLSILRFAHYEFVTELTGCRQRNFRFVLEDIKTRFSGLELHLFFSALGWITNTSTAATRKTDAWVCKSLSFLVSEACKTLVHYGPSRVPGLSKGPKFKWHFTSKEGVSNGFYGVTATKFICFVYFVYKENGSALHNTLKEKWKRYIKVVIIKITF